jgi:hypothetical protein
MIAFDPSYIAMSGKHTPGVGCFWSGCASKAKWGLELCGFAVVDISANTALHYFAAQTLREKSQGLINFYCGFLAQQAPELLKISRCLGADAFFFQKTFVDTAIKGGLDVITRLRDDAVLYYAPSPKSEGQIGRLKKHGDRFWALNPDAEQLPCIAQTEGQRIYGGVVYVKSLKRLVMMAIVYEPKEDGSVKSVKVFICTDLEFPAQNIWPWYKRRVQIEFLYRDAKQHTGLEYTQCRRPKSSGYHFNMSLTAVSIAKVAYYLSIDKNLRGSFSMADIRMQYFNELVVNRVFDVFVNMLKITKNNLDIKNLYNLDKIAV